MFMLMYKVYSIRISGDSFWQSTRRANVEGECDLPPDNTIVSIYANCHSNVVVGAEESQRFYTISGVRHKSILWPS